MLRMMDIEKREYVMTTDMAIYRSTIDEWFASGVE